MMNRKQFVIDTAEMLLVQGSYSLSEDGVSCLYKNEQGNCCAIGLHMKAADCYDPEFEGISANYLTRDVSENLFEKVKPFKTYLETKYNFSDERDSGFLGTVQRRLHDSRANSGYLIATVEESLVIMRPLLPEEQEQNDSR